MKNDNNINTKLSIDLVLILLSFFKVTYEAASYNRDISANCPLCKHITDDIGIGNCEGCNQTVYDVNNMTEEIKLKMEDPKEIIS